MNLLEKILENNRALFDDQVEPAPKRYEGMSMESHKKNIVLTLTLRGDTGDFLNIFTPNKLSDYNQLIPRLDKKSQFSYCISYAIRKQTAENRSKLS